ncbi:BTAD domain-containing putative transcriptional regulator [Embleya sp. NPDC127516]|uniref:BTAD domain-containing putative transcriptional regulator n=1 Tax=Embleya sp. NPDC127516 TaxID=3363990 RepID=UPI003811DD90
MVYLRVLGPFEADVDDVTVPLGGPRQRAVLALLVAARGRVVSIDRMIEDLWRGEPPAQAVTSLQAYVSNLRRLLEPGRARRAPATVLVSAAPGYALRLPDDAVDAWRFERLLRAARERLDAAPVEARTVVETALALWRGPAFAAASDEPWALAEAARLSELHLNARELHIAAGLRSGAAAAAAADAERLTRDAPLREEAWRLHALALWAGNRQADALATLRRARAVLAADVGLDPGPALTEVEAAILGRRMHVLRAATGRAEAAVEGPGVGRAPSGPEAGPAAIGAADPAGGRSGSQVEDPARGARADRTVTGADSAHSAEDASGDHPAAPTAGRPSDAIAAAMNPRPGVDPHSGVTGELFVGRDGELAALLGEADQVASAGLRVALVTGEAGLGKSALLGRLGAGLEQAGLLVATGRCPEVDGAPPAWAWVEALRAIAAIVPPPPEAAAALAPLLGDDEGDGPGQDTSAGRFRLHRAVWSWLAAAARRQPLAILLDDVHRADAETLALLAAGADGDAAGAPLFVVAAYRPDEVDGRLTETLAGLARRSPVRLALAGLPEAAVARVVDAVSQTPVDAATITALAERTGGNPFYVRESARLLDSEGALVALSDVPEGVRDVLRRRLARLPEPAVAVLRLASVAGREVDVDVLVESAEVDEGGVVDALDAGLIAGLLTEPAPGRIRFVHALVRDTMAADLSGLRRTRMHTRIAAALERLGTRDVSALAHHYGSAATAATAARAVETGIAAAELAERRFAHDTAVALLTRALECLDRIPADTPGDRDAQRADLFGRLLRAQVRAGDVAAARQTRQRAFDAAESAHRDDLTIAAFTAWTVPTPWQSRPYGVLDLGVVAALRRLIARTDLAPETRCRLLNGYAGELVGERIDPDPRVLAKEAVALAADLGDPDLRTLTLATLIGNLAGRADAPARAASAGELMGLADTFDLPAHRWYARFSLATAAADLNDPKTTRRLVDESVAIADAYRMPEAIGVGACALAALAHVEGRLEEAEERYVRATESMIAQGSLHALGLRWLALATIRLSQGRLAELAPQAPEILAGFGPFLADLCALVVAADGRIEQARAMRASVEPIRADFFDTLMSTFRAAAVVALAEHDEAAALYPTLSPLHDAAPGCAGVSLAIRPPAHTLGELARFLGREQEATEHFDRAAEIAETWNAHHWAAESRTARDLYRG